MKGRRIGWTAQAGLVVIVALLTLLLPAALAEPGSPGALAPQSYCNIVVVGKGVGLEQSYPRPTATTVPGGAAPPRKEWPTNGLRLDTIAPSFTINNSALGQQARARIEYARNPSFEPVDYWFGFGSFQGSATAPLDMNLLEGTTYYWRTRSSLDGVLWGNWSSVWSFFTPSGGTVAGTPTLISPANGSTVSTLRPRFRWNAVPGATKYALSIAQYVFIQASTDFTISQNLEPGHTYQWTVAARNAYGWGTPSEAWTVITSVTAASPSDGASSEDAAVEVASGERTILLVD